MIAGQRNWRQLNILQNVTQHAGQPPVHQPAGSCWVDVQPMSAEKQADVVSSTPGLESGPIMYKWFTIFTLGRQPPLINRTDLLREQVLINPATNALVEYHVQGVNNWGDHLEIYAQMQMSPSTHES